MQYITSTVKKTPAPSKHAAVAGKYPPHALDLEESVLGALLLEREAFHEVADILKPETFYKEAHQDIYRAMIQLFQEAEPIDMRTVVHQLRKAGDLDRIGGAAYIAKLTHHVASAAHIVAHAHILVEFAIRRALIRVSSKMQAEAYDQSIETFALLDKAEQAFFDIADHNIRKSYDDISNLLKQAIQELEERKGRQDGLVGIPTGFHRLDQLLLGCQRSDFMVIAARPGMGKTSFMLSLIANAAIRHRAPVAFFSLEMSALQITNRLMAAEVGLSSEKIKKANLKDHEWQQLFSKSAALSEAPIYIDDTPGLSLFEFRAKCRRLKAKHGIQLVVVDYLQLMTEHSRRLSGTREQEIAAISSGLKAIAKELDIAVIAASQLSRAVETRGGDKRPMLSDLRESGAIEQDVDIAMFLYRADYYGIAEDEQGAPTEGVAEVIVAKHRNGPLGKVRVRYEAPITRFSNLEEGMDGGTKGFVIGP